MGLTLSFCGVIDKWSEPRHAGGPPCPGMLASEQASGVKV